MRAASFKPARDTTPSPADAHPADPYTAVYDPLSRSQPLKGHDIEYITATLPELAIGCDTFKEAVIPSRTGDEAYLFPHLSENEYLRLSMLWYHTQALSYDEQLLASMQTKVDLMRLFVGWDYAICGILDLHSFRRLVTSNIETAVVPRRESPCSHTIQGTKGGSILAISDMSKDWRFALSPPALQGGLRSYAGTPIVCKTEQGESAALGSLCVASTKPNLELTSVQKEALVRFAEMLSSDLVNRTNLRRREQQQRMGELLARISTHKEPDEHEVLSILTQIYPHSEVRLCPIRQSTVVIEGERGANIPLSDLHKSLWEDTAAIKNLIEEFNHLPPKTENVVRAVIGRLWSQSTPAALVVATSDIYNVFDDVDAWFIDRCSALLSNASQRRLLNEARSAKERFLRGITHQLRTPIHGVLGSVDLLAEELMLVELQSVQNSPNLSRKTSTTTPRRGTLPGPNGAPAFSSDLNTADFIRTIRNSGRELMSTVNNMIALSRWEAVADARMTPALSDLSSIEDTILEQTLNQTPDAESGRVCVFFDNQLSDNVSAAMLDMDLLSHCLSLLLTNALQYSARGCVVFCINVTEDLSILGFDIMDTGCGIKEADQARVFEAFEKIDEHGRGAGIGLTVAAKIASAMNGDLRLVSSSNEGSHFRVEFHDPGLGCLLRQREAPQIKRLEELRTYCILPHEPQTLIVKQLDKYLRRRGLQKQKAASHSDMTIVTYHPDRTQFEGALRPSKARAGPVFCLVPIGEDIEHLEKTHAHIRFFVGPFTTARINDILAEIDSLLPRRRKTSIESGDLSRQVADVPSQHSNDAEAPDAGPSALPFSCAHRYPSARPNVLLADDNEINLRIVKMYCAKRLLPYRTSVDGVEAVEQFLKALDAKDPIDLVLLDLQMPRCDGIQACERIRAIEKGRGLRRCVIFIVTGQDWPTDKERAVAAGADRFYVKPLRLKALDKSIAEYFDMHG